MPEFDVCVIGSLNVDLVVRAPRLPSPGETLLGATFQRYPGGKGANQAVAAARAGARVALVGAVGADEHGELLLETLRAEHVDVTCVARRASTPTGVALITVTESGENSIVVVPGANGSVDAALVDAARGTLLASRRVVAQLEVPLAALEHAFALARAARIATCLNAAPARAELAPLLGLSDVLVVNENEARILSGRTTGELEVGAGAAHLRHDATSVAPAAVQRALACSNTLLQLGPELVFVTLGRHGALLDRRDGELVRPAYDVVSQDSVAAGDAFVGALAAEFDSGASLEQLLDFACAAGALATTRSGAIPSLPSRARITALAASRRPSSHDARRAGPAAGP